MAIYQLILILLHINVGYANISGVQLSGCRVQGQGNSVFRKKNFFVTLAIHVSMDCNISTQL